MRARRISNRAYYARTATHYLRYAKYLPVWIVVGVVCFALGFFLFGGVFLFVPDPWGTIAWWAYFGVVAVYLTFGWLVRKRRQRQ